MLKPADQWSVGWALALTGFAAAGLALTLFLPFIPTVGRVLLGITFLALTVTFSSALVRAVRRRTSR